MRIEDYHAMLEQNDSWHYQMEESSDRYELGRAAHLKLQDISRESREHLKLWNAWCDHVYATGSPPQLSIHLKPVVFNDPNQLDFWRRYRTSPVTEDELMDCYQYGRVG